jgi:hypothetical protein
MYPSVATSGNRGSYRNERRPSLFSVEGHGIWRGTVTRQQVVGSDGPFTARRPRRFRTFLDHDSTFLYQKTWAILRLNCAALAADSTHFCSHSDNVISPHQHFTSCSTWNAAWLVLPPPCGRQRLKASPASRTFPSWNTAREPWKSLIAETNGSCIFPINSMKKGFAIAALRAKRRFHTLGWSFPLGTVVLWVFPSTSVMVSLKSGESTGNVSYHIKTKSRPFGWALSDSAGT